MNIQNKTFSYAGFWKRFAAFVIDMFILAIGNFFIGFIFAIPDDVLTGKAEFIKSVDSYILSGLFDISHIPLKSAAIRFYPPRPCLICQRARLRT